MFAFKTAANKVALPATRVASRRCISSSATKSGNDLTVYIYAGLFFFFNI